MKSKRQYCTSVFIIDFETEKALLMYNKKLNKWLQPGGHIDDELLETPIEAAKREAFEETGVEIEIIGEKIYDTASPLCTARYINKVGDMIDIQYVGIPINKNLINFENNETGWFTTDEMESMNVDEEIILKVRYI